MTDTTATKTRTLKPFNLPAGEVQKMPAAGSKRLVAYQLLNSKEGATLEEVMAETGWNRRNSAEGVRLLNKHNGYALVQGEDGRIRLS